MCSIMIIPITFLLFSLGYLIFLNIYLMNVNLTTWEIFSWHKISYLNEFKKEDESPFSDVNGGDMRNYWFTGYKGLKTWKAKKI